ncbi:MAG: hypothetical protein KAW12_09340 [Candidatus Aminicenantes bacterium]|nr:hypothetical protein [Candidatus Aminicenantes bacterium]
MVTGTGGAAAKTGHLREEYPHLSMPEQKKRLIDELQKHRGKEERRDDILILGMKMSD